MTYKLNGAVTGGETFRLLTVEWDVDAAQVLAAGREVDHVPTEKLVGVNAWCAIDVERAMGPDIDFEHPLVFIPLPPASVLGGGVGVSISSTAIIGRTAPSPTVSPPCPRSYSLPQRRSRADGGVAGTPSPPRNFGGCRSGMRSV